MSFFNNNNNSTGFGGSGGFGANNNTTGGFGASNASTGGSLFGGNTATAGGFGSNSGGFGSTNTGFGAKPTGFGASATPAAGNSLFGGGNTNTTGGFGSGGGFGSSTNNASTGFGGNNSTSLFGQPKPATGGFGSTNTPSLFGGGNTTGGFGSTANTNSNNPFGATNNANSGFGATNTTSGFGGGFGASTNTATNNAGTGSVPFNPLTEKDGANNPTSSYQAITCMQNYQNKSFEELRMEDYLQGRRFGNTNGQPGSFGTSTGFGGSAFGNTNNTAAPASGSGLFGGNTATSNTGFGGGFGANNNASTSGGFGSNTGTGLFGNVNKPATTGLFGSPAGTNTATGGFGSTNTNSTGLFGNNNNNNTTSAFGSNTGSTGGGLFGNNNAANNQPNKGFAGFGSTNNNNSLGGFGAGNNNTSTAGTSLFGNTNNNANSGSLFGSTNTQPNNTFGAANNNTGTGLFGQPNKPATTGLFGNTTSTPTTGTSLFGGNNNQTQPASSGGLFGNSNANNTSTNSLFGASKPATGSLFGNTTPANNTGGGLFGGNTNTAQPGASLFGNNNNTNNSSSLFGNNNATKPGTSSLFGGTAGTNANNNSSLSLFGNQNQQPQANSGGSLFGSTNQNQNLGNSGSLFGNSMNQSMQQQPNQLHANLTLSPYGNDQLFGSLSASGPPVGPLATPLTGAKPAQSKAPSLLSSTRFNSPSYYSPKSSALGRVGGGYGLSYSNMSTPGSAFSATLTPGASSLLKPTGSLGSALSSRLSKSLSRGSLRGESSPREGESLLRPNLGGGSSRYLATGSMRKLNIDRSLRVDLFSPPEPKQIEAAPKGIEDNSLKKKVSFGGTSELDKTSTDAEPSANNAIVRVEEYQDATETSSLFSSVSASQSISTPEMSQINGKSLTTVPEDRELQRSSSVLSAKEKIPKTVELGEYWTKPAIKDLKQMSRAQLQKVGGFIVGRQGVGHIEFGPVDLTNTDLDDICGNIVQLEARKATVYPSNRTKPAMGKALNVPSTIYLENIHPKATRGKRVGHVKNEAAMTEKHIHTLKTVSGTQFKSWDPDTAVWCFTVEHYTTYGLDDDDDDEEEITEDVLQSSSALSDPPSTPGLIEEEEETQQSIDIGAGLGDMDDTFEFKINRRSQSSVPGAHVPGGFDDSRAYVDDSEEDASADESVMDEAVTPDGFDEEDMEDPFTVAQDVDQEDYSPSVFDRDDTRMAFDDDSRALTLAEDFQAESEEPELPGTYAPSETKLLRSILKPTTRAFSIPSPEKLINETWEEQLQRTISPKKRDRQALREFQEGILQPISGNDFHDSTFQLGALGQSVFGQSVFGQSALDQSYLGQKSAKKAGLNNSVSMKNPSQAFRTSIDIMNSLFEQDVPKMTKAVEKGFQNPYPKKPRISSTNLSEQDAHFHDSTKPSFSRNGVLVYSTLGSAPPTTGELESASQPIVGEHKDIRFAKWTIPSDLTNSVLSNHRSIAAIETNDGFPLARPADVQFTLVASSISDLEAPTTRHEKAIWQLAGLLFDPIPVSCQELAAGMSPERVAELESRLLMDSLANFWAQLVRAEADERMSSAKSAEEKALLHLTKNDVSGACDVLLGAKDFRLATLVAKLPLPPASQQIMRSQIQAWRDRNDWSEMSDAIRALYSILAGQTASVEGKGGAPEDRASSFRIAERFGLTWRQSFGLRLYFAGANDFASVIRAYSEDLEAGVETVRPLPAWIEKGSDEGGDDVLMGLLRLHIGTTELKALLDPKLISGSAVNSRIAWQLAIFLYAKSNVLPDEQLDALSLDFATELEVAGEFVTAAWVLLHIRDFSSRQLSVTELLTRNASQIPLPATTTHDAETPDIFDLLTTDLGLSPELIWNIKAQHARAALENPALQTEWLLRAGSIDQAHDVLCRTVGPLAVIEEDYDTLKALISSFPRSPRPDGWARGGQVFMDFVKMTGVEKEHAQHREGVNLLTRLNKGLRVRARDMDSGLEEKVALSEMMRAVGEKARTVYQIMDDEDQAMTGMPAQGGDRAGQGPAMGLFEKYTQALGVVL